ncbi:uncharacterized protein BP5553_05249 [Venustampulla echinocandica]|uniref:J domain-containing protein n=1 Tax=Venustampulla echinocandica TaxID=2656787 RepID=A0A370TQK8_9HELO|nr:uncharacterized protein BP5553_05249 [Venustampulla echinocandica]RDL37816.1 hypothetical protein BP5553_05249 [Venustampulla echinocandica]
MPFRSSYCTPAPRLQRLFHSSPRCLDVGTAANHYKTLQIPTNATPSEVKKSFYALSIKHHPDKNPDDPNASKRFIELTEAYSVLGIPAKRQQYDRDFRHSHPHSHRHQPAHKGSYHSSGPAGGRPASGLSRRRAQFRGPPPSFYSSGGWGSQASKRQAAQESSTAYAFTGGGMGPGQSPFGEVHAQNVPHFDRSEHLRTHQNHIRRQMDRRRQNGDHTAGGGGLHEEGTKGTLMTFLAVGGIVALGVWLPWAIGGRLLGGSEPGRKRERI